MGSRIIELAAFYQILFAQLYINTFILAQSDSIKRRAMYFKNHDPAKGMTSLNQQPPFPILLFIEKMCKIKVRMLNLPFFLDFPKF